MKSNLKMSGVLTITVRGAKGKIKSREVHKNLIVTTGRNHVADQLAGQSEAPMSHMAIGTGTTPQDFTDTALEAELSRKALDSKSQGSGADANKITYICSWGAGEGTGTITEAGIFNSAAAGVMMCRTKFNPKDKGTGDSITLTWVITALS
jgi:hypothetical protein